MSSGTTLLERFTDADIDWLLGANDHRAVAPGEPVIAMGEAPSAMYLLIEGVLGVMGAHDGKPLQVIGPGEVVGEMSFVEHEVPSRTVAALEASTLLVLEHVDLRRRADSDPAFAARLYRALALLLSRRLRRSTNDLAAERAASFEDDAERAVWDELAVGVQRFKDLLHAGNRAAMKRGGAMPAADEREVRDHVVAMYGAMESAIGDRAPGSEPFKEQVGIRIQKELLPYVLMTKVIGRCYTKPRGYAGDYMTIEWIYRTEPGGVPPLGVLLDACLLDIPVAVAVRNRRGLLTEEILEIVADRDGEQAQVMSLACGPAREIFDVFALLGEQAPLRATLVDFDNEALAYVAEHRDRLGLADAVDLAANNLIHLALGRKTLDVAPQDLIYSIGLIDYFADELVVKLMNLIHSLLRPGGKAILGNFHTSNPCKAFMDHVLEWRLIHRDEADMDRLYRMSAFGRACTNIRFEDQGVNLFAACVKS